MRRDLPMLTRDARERVAAAVAADAAARERLALARTGVQAALRSAVGSPGGLAAAFGAGLLAGPSLRGLARAARSSKELSLTLAAFGLGPRDLLHGLGTVYRNLTAPRPASAPAASPPTTPPRP